MLGVPAKARENGPASPRSDLVGEIDTKAPFRSVKAAVSLFGEVGSPKTRPVSKRSNSDERVLEKETQHHMLLRELDYYKEQLKNAETTKSQALKDLQRAHRTLHELTNKLEALSESKQASIRASEAAKARAQELEELRTLRAQLGSDAWKVDLENAREAYKACTGQLTDCKQELASLRQDLDSALEHKLTVFQEAEDAQAQAQANQQAQAHLEVEVGALHRALAELELEVQRAEEEHLRAMAEKENQLQARRSEVERAQSEARRLREAYEPEETLQEKLQQTMDAVKVLQAQLNDIQGTDLYTLKTTFSELDKSKKALDEAVREERSLQAQIDSMRKQLEEVKNKCLELEAKVNKEESSAEQMQTQLEKRKVELEEAMSGCASVMQSSIDKLSAEAEKARLEAQGIKKKAVTLNLEAEALRLATKESEEKLRAALEEAEAAKKDANDKICNYEGKESGGSKIIRLSVEEFESMNRKIVAFKNEADLKVSTAMTQVESINANEMIVMEKVEMVVRENEAIESGIKEAVKRADMAEAAKKIVESELQKWRMNEKSEVEKSFNKTKAT
ncbi:WEB family protein [Striga hermonthica]|uniref:WEB family protein n=1 Tax=Striga hermonthica TaxID=68872 RepID=A0A9N7N1I7_STRHE|nr:WEB family protein [Striga hermonthica]